MPKLARFPPGQVIATQAGESTKPSSSFNIPDPELHAALDVRFGSKADISIRGSLSPASTSANGQKGTLGASAVFEHNPTELAQVLLTQCGLQSFQRVESRRNIDGPAFKDRQCLIVERVGKICRDSNWRLFPAYVRGKHDAKFEDGCRHQSLFQVRFGHVKPLRAKDANANVPFGSKADISSPFAGRPARTSAIGQEQTFRSLAIE